MQKVCNRSKKHDIVPKRLNTLSNMQKNQIESIKRITFILYTPSYMDSIIFFYI